MIIDTCLILMYPRPSSSWIAHRSQIGSNLAPLKTNQESTEHKMNQQLYHNKLKTVFLNNPRIQFGQGIDASFFDEISHFHDRRIVGHACRIGVFTGRTSSFHKTSLSEARIMMCFRPCQMENPDMAAKGWVGFSRGFQQIIFLVQYANYGLHIRTL